MATDIIVGTRPATKVKRRCRSITIGNPYQGIKTIDMAQEDIEIQDDGTPIGRSEAAPQLSELVDNLVGKVYDIADPVTGQTVSVSGAAVAIWLETYYIERATA